MSETFLQGHAVVVGVGADLPNTVEDAVGLADILRDPGRCAYPPDQVHLLTEGEATATDIRAALRTLAESTSPKSTALVYFSGHGYRVASPTAELYYLLPYGYDVNRLHETGISGAEFVRLLQAIPAQRLLILLDCCHAGGVGEAKAPESQLTKSPLPPQARGLLAEGSGRVLIASSREDELSFAGKPYSAFTLALIEALCGAGVAKRDGYVRVADLALHAREMVPNRTGGRQHPILHFEHADNFVLAYYAGGDERPKDLPFAAEPQIEPEPGSWTLIDQRGQTVYGPQTTITGPVEQQFGDRISIGDIHYGPPIEVPPPPEPTRPPEVIEFVGREEELSYFGEKLATSHLAVITGMAGVGKTTLAARLARRFAEPDQALWHVFHEDQGIDHTIWDLAGFLAWNGQEDLWRMLQCARQTDGQMPPYRVLFDYVRQMLRGQGYLLCFDNFQLTDDDLLIRGFIEHIRNAVLAGELSLIIASRRTPRFAWAAEFEPLHGLRPSAISRLLVERGLSLSNGLATDLYAHTEGNAQLLVLAIDILQRARDPARLMARLSEADNIARYLMCEVDEGLAEAERDVMSAVAVLLGYPGTRDAIEAILGVDNVQRTLINLSGRHLLTVRNGETGEAYGQHAMVQAFYYTMLGRRERREMHRRAAEHYETEEPDALKAARHFERAGEYERAAELATADVWALINQGQAKALRRLLERFTAQQLNVERWVTVNLARGQVYALLGEGQAARESYQEALAQLDDLPDSPTVRELRVHACRGMAGLLEHESPQEALNWLHRGLEELAEASNLLEAELHLKVGSIQIVLGDYDAALSATERGLALLPEGPSWLRAGALINLGNIYSSQGDIGRGNEYTLRGLEISSRLHDYFRMLVLLSNLGVNKDISGDWEGAVADYQQALNLAKRLGSVAEQVRIENYLGILFTKQGEDDSAMVYLSHALDLARDHGLKEDVIYILHSLADLQIRSGEWKAAEKALEESEQLALEMDTKYVLPEIYSGQAQVHLTRGWRVAALNRAERSVKLAHNLGLSREKGMSLRVLGQALLAEDQREEALAAFEQSLSILAELDPYEAARTKMVWGRILVSGRASKRRAPLRQRIRTVLQKIGAKLGLISREDWKRGTALLREARATFQELGAKHDWAAANEALGSG